MKCLMQTLLSLSLSFFFSLPSLPSLYERITFGFIMHRYNEVRFPSSNWSEITCFGWKNSNNILHDDVTKWKRFPRHWSFVRGIHRSPVNSPHKDQWRGALMFSLICAWMNGWVNNGEAGDLRRHRAHYDVTVMNFKGYRADKLQQISIMREVVIDSVMIHIL